MTFTLAPKVLGVGPMRLLIVAILFCAFTETLSSAADTAQSCRLRFIDAATLKPISLQKFLFIPRKIFAKMAPGSPDPNLEFAKPFTTDRDGYFQISEALIKELTDDGKIYVDCSSGPYARFLLRLEHLPNQKAGYTITLFHAAGCLTEQSGATDPRIPRGAAGARV